MGEGVGIPDREAKMNNSMVWVRQVITVILALEWSSNHICKVCSQLLSQSILQQPCMVGRVMPGKEMSTCSESQIMPSASIF